MKYIPGLFVIGVTIIGFNLLVTKRLPDLSRDEGKSPPSQFAMAGKDEALEELEKVHKWLKLNHRKY